MFKSVLPARLTTALLTGTMLTIAAPVAAEVVSTARSFSVPAGPAAASVPQFARQAGIQVLLSVEAAQGIRTNAVAGQLTPRQGLDRLLAGTGLRIATWRDGVVTLARQQGPEAPDDRQSSDAQDARNVGSEEIVVVGVTSPFRSKDNSTTIVETAVYDDLETLAADGSIAGLLAQLPGISTEEDADQPRYITVRGISADLNHTTIDGLTTATVGENGGGTRRVNLQLIPSDLARRVDLFKTFTAEQDAGAIGGAINIVTRSAFDKGQQGLFVDVFGVYSTYKGEEGSNAGGDARRHWGGGVKANYGLRFGANEQFGLVLTGRYEDRVRNSSKRWQDNKMFFTDDGVNIAAPDHDLGWNGLAAPGNHGYGSFTNSVEAWGGSAKLEYEAPDQSVYGSVIAYDYVRVEDSTMNSNWIDAAREIYDQTAEGGRQRITYITENWRHNQWRRENRGILGNATYAFGNSRLTARAGLSEESYRDWEPYVGVRASPVDSFMRYSSADLPDIIELEDPTVLQRSDYELRTQREKWNWAKQRVFDTRLDFSSNVGRGSRGLGIVTGVEWRRLDMDKDVTEANYSASDIVNDWVYDPGYVPAGAPGSFAWVDYHSFRAERWDQTPINERNSFHYSLTPDYGYREDTATGYVSLHYNLPATTIVAGLRYDDVSFEADTPVIEGGTATGNFSRNEGGYDSWLPSVNVVHRLGNTNLRLSWSETIGRPNPSSIATAENVSCGDNEEGGVTCSVTRGNPNLKPRRSRNLDATVEHYYAGNNGMLLIGYFHKKIRDDIFTLRQEEIIDGEPWLVRQPVNASSSNVQGVEFAWVHRGLPVGIADHKVDLSFNAARMWGEMEYVSDTITRGIDRLLSQPDWIANGSATYRIPAIGGAVRLNATYRDTFMSSIGANPWQDRANENLFVTNIAAWHAVTDNVTFKYEWNNVFDSQPRFRIGENDEWVRQIDEYGTSFYFHAVLQF